MKLLAGFGLRIKELSLIEFSLTLRVLLSLTTNKPLSISLIIMFPLKMIKTVLR